MVAVRDSIERALRLLPADYVTPSLEDPKPMPDSLPDDLLGFEYYGEDFGPDHSPHPVSTSSDSEDDDTDSSDGSAESEGSDASGNTDPSSESTSASGDDS